jgi:hypothetical protein
MSETNLVPKIDAIIAGKSRTRQEVQTWEDRRASAVMRKLSVDGPNMSRLERRRALLARKLALGHGGIRETLRRELSWSARIARLTATLSGGRRKLSTCDLVVGRGSADAFCEWFRERTRQGDEPPMLDASPDHYIIATGSDGKQVVVETTGGAPFASEFVIDYSDSRGIQTALDPTCPIRIVGTARLKDGVIAGGVCHQFRQEGEGFRAKLSVEFPMMILPYMIAEHRWHLAAEFSNWIEAASAS